MEKPSKRDLNQVIKVNITSDVMSMSWTPETMQEKGP